MRRAPSVPPELPGYTFVRVLGSGGFSDVYLYHQQLPRRRVAVKVLLTDELSSATRSAFVDEANLMAQLSAHPYIVTIFHADVAADYRPYFVMEYCAGPSLAESYKRSPMSVADALRTGVRLSSAIATAHAAGILHRDIKPANVLTNDYGWPALTDFGISSAVDDELQPVHTGTLADALAEAEGGVAALVAVAVVVGLAIGGVPGAVDPTPGPTEGAAPAVVEGVPTPTEAAPPALEGTSAVFTVENPEPEPDDAFIWRVSNSSDDRSRRAAEGRIVVDAEPGQRTCVEIWVVRDGRQSPDPYEGCFPQ